MKTKLIAIFLTLVTAALLSGCGGVVQNAQKVATKFVGGVKMAYVQINNKYMVAAPMETTMAADFQQWYENYSSIMTGAGESYFAVKGCYKDSEAAIQAMAAGVFGEDASGNPVSAEAEKQAFVSALVSGGSLYGSDGIKKCQDMTDDLVKYIRINREKLTSQRGQLIDEMRAYELFLNSTMEDAAFQKMLTEYGPQVSTLIDSGDEGLQQYLHDNGLLSGEVKVLPSGFIGFPTQLLTAKTTDKDLCQYYRNVGLGKEESPSGYPKEFYTCRWYQAAGGYGELGRRAAWEVMNAPFLSEQAANRINCGKDAGFIGQEVNEDCQTVPTTPEP